MAARRSSKADKLLTAYAAWFDSENGRLVLADLKRIYHDRTSVAVDFDPHRALVTEGCRSVYLGIVAMIREAKKHGRRPNDTAQLDDIDEGIDAAGAILE